MSALSLKTLSDSASLRISHAGLGGWLVDPETSGFDLATQRKLWALGEQLVTMQTDGFLEVIPGVNNLLVLFDPSRLHPERAQQLIIEWWHCVEGSSVSGREIEIPVVYGGQAGEDLSHLAGEAGLDIAEWVRLHSEATYTVACVGSMPGFAYMAGLPDKLAAPRRSTPRLEIPEGAVIIGGVQTGVMPCSAPSGWHLIGSTDLRLFDPHAATPCLLSPGDQVKFTIRGVES